MSENVNESNSDLVSKDTHYDPINDPMSYVTDIFGKYKIMSRYLVFLVSFVWVYSTLFHPTLDKDIYMEVSEIFKWTLILHLIGVNGIERLAEVLKTFANNKILPSKQ